MQIHKVIKETINEHKQKIELTQWAIIAGISSLFYSQYLSKMKHKDVRNKTLIHVPAIKNVARYLNIDSEFMKYLSDNLIDNISNHSLIKKYSNAPELILFNEPNIDLMKTIYDFYISMNISRRITETISKKFGLDNENQQTFIERWEIDLFDGNINNDQYKFILDQIVLQLLMLLPTMEREIEVPENRMNMMMSKGEILTINNENAICPIHFTDEIIKNKSVINLLSFVTNTTIEDMSGGDMVPQKNNIIVNYIVNTGVYNQVIFTRLKGIKYQENKLGNNNS